MELTHFVQSNTGVGNLYVHPVAIAVVYAPLVMGLGLILVPHDTALSLRV